MTGGPQALPAGLSHFMADPDKFLLSNGEKAAKIVALFWWILRIRR